IDVLHVNDEPTFAEMMATFLEREHEKFNINSVTSADEGIDFLAEHEVDCIVSDYDMPGTDGIEFLEEVREEYTDLPFILFTGKGSEEVASEAISAGVTDYLQKEGGSEQYELL
ncbi:MAG: response regulator, partial [Halobacteriaceae archaeon]